MASPRRFRRGGSKSRATRAKARAAGFRSAFEQKVALALEPKFRAVGYETTALRYTKEAKYIPDFVCATTDPKDDIVYVEAKGRFLSADRSKMIQVKKAHPTLDIRIVFMRDNKLNKASSTTYMEWAAKHGFKATVYPELPL